MQTKRRTTTICCAACVAALCLGAPLAGCTTGTTGTSFNDQTAVFQDEGDATFTPASLSEVSSEVGQPVVITEQGWNADDDFVHYGIMVQNPNSALIARNTVVHVTLYDKKGKVMAEDASTINFIGPDTTIGYAGNKVGDGTKPARVEVAVEEGSTIWQDAEGYTAPFTIDTVTEKDALYYRYQINGEITNHTGEYASTVPLSFIIRDDEGAICGGYVGKAYRIKAGRTKSFKITINTVPDHATLEVYPLVYVEGEEVNTSNSSYY